MFKELLACLAIVSLAVVLQGCGSIDENVTTTTTIRDHTNMATTTTSNEPQSTSTTTSEKPSTTTTTTSNKPPSTSTITSEKPPTTTTSTSKKEPLVDPDDQHVANAVNAIYTNDDDGVLIHVIDYTEDSKNPWVACLTNSSPSCGQNQPLGRLSFVVLNHFAWNGKDKQIDAFKQLTNVGFIGTQNVLSNDVDCLFPGDGGTQDRNNSGCGCIQTHPVQCEDGYDWCDPVAKEWDGVCAMKPNQLASMLAQFKARGNEFRYNEAIVNGMKWNTNVSDNLKAFVVPTGDQGQCGEETTCYRNFVAWYADYKAQHGSKTILGLDVTIKDTPFTPLPQPSEVPQPSLETSSGNTVVII